MQYILQYLHLMYVRRDLVRIIHVTGTYIFYCDCIRPEDGLYRRNMLLIVNYKQICIWIWFILICILVWNIWDSLSWMMIFILQKLIDVCVRNVSRAQRTLNRSFYHVCV